MPVPTTAADLSTTAASNSPAGADAIGTSHDDYMRATFAIIKQQDSKGSDIASTTTIDVPSSGKYFVVTGTTTIAGISDDWNGRSVILKFSGALQLTHSSAFILPTSANITTAAGDCLIAVNESTGVWRVIAFQRADGSILSPNYAKKDTAQTFTALQSFSAGAEVTGAARIGYGTGAGGSVTQLTNKSTSVTLNTPTGQITTNNAALASGATVVFTVNNSVCSATDVVVLNITSGVSGFDNYIFWTNPNDGAFNVIIYNRTLGSLSEAIVFNFAIIKGVTS